MSARLHVVTLVRNEARGYLPSALRAWECFADGVIALDDASEDKTRDLLWKSPIACVFDRLGDRRAWGAESAARRELFEIAMEQSEPGDYLLWLDADMVPMRSPRDFLCSADTYYFTLYDLWGEDAHGRLLYREDAFWRAHFAPRAWMVRRPRHFRGKWPRRGLHCGHLPSNWPVDRPFFVPPSHALLHYAYFDEARRVAKAAKYLEQNEHLSEFEREHARSIVDPGPLLKPLFECASWRLSLP